MSLPPHPRLPFAQEEFRRRGGWETGAYEHGEHAAIAGHPDERETCARSPRPPV
ncbi:hypothetical protein [Streptomyces sp. NBC_00344]|uniref:hypothetical protein n=1 Tax=Streptomyces sp. NBC_00344 TaxID=2975720 RepID=UPI002E1ACEAC